MKKILLYTLVLGVITLASCDNASREIPMRVKWINDNTISVRHIDSMYLVGDTIMIGSQRIVVIDKGLKHQ